MPSWVNEVENLPIPRFLRWLRGVLSEPDGTPSSTRVLMYAFSIFSMWVIWHCFNHIFQLTDVNQITIWLSNMPMLLTAFMGLIALPYGINKGSATFSDIATTITAAKNGNKNEFKTGLSKVEQDIASTPAPPPLSPKM